MTEIRIEGSKVQKLQKALGKPVVCTRVAVSAVEAIQAMREVKSGRVDWSCTRRSCNLSAGVCKSMKCG
jgi:hypothetical protein